MTHEARLVDLLSFTRDGEWGNDQPSDGYSPALVVRGTDFSEVRAGNLATLPMRYIRSDVLARKAIVAGDILIETAGGTKDQPTGRSVFISDSVVARANFPLICASFARFLRPNISQVEPNFLFWKLQDEYVSRRMFPYHVQHTGVARFQYTQFAETHPFLLPDLPEQRAIASILVVLDDKIELNRRMNETLEAMARAIFKDWFVDFGPTRAKMEGRTPYLAPEIWSLFPDRLDGEGKPEGWQRISLREAADVSSGGTPTKNNMAYWNGSIPWISPKVMTGLHVSDSDQRVTPAAVGNGTRLAPAGSVLLMVRGMGLHQGVRVSQARNDVAFNQDIKALVPRRISAAHLLFGMLDATPYLFSKVEASGHGTGTLPTDIVETVQFVSPRAVAYNELVVPLDLLNEKIALNNQEAETLAATRDLLLPKLMSGEIRVREAEKIVSDVM